MIKLEVGKHYKTRDGRKVGPLEWRDSPYSPYKFMTSRGERIYKENGETYEPGANDLISEWPTHPEQGTLKEIGAQVGDVVEMVSCGPSKSNDHIGRNHTIQADGQVLLDGGNGSYWGYLDDNDEHDDYAGVFRIISRAAQSTPSPVRTVTTTRQEIVPGVYGKVHVYSAEKNRVDIQLTDQMDDYNLDGYSTTSLTHTELTEAIRTLTLIRDAMEGE